LLRSGLRQRTQLPVHGQGLNVLLVSGRGLIGAVCAPGRWNRLHEKTPNAGNRPLNFTPSGELAKVFDPDYEESKGIMNDLRWVK
jgi:hypothetical protein